MNERELNITTFTASANSPLFMRITHLVTGESITGQGIDKTELKKRLIEELEKKCDKAARTLEANLIDLM